MRDIIWIEIGRFQLWTFSSAKLQFYEIAETSEKIFISADFPDEYVNSESRMVLKGAVANEKQMQPREFQN